MRKQTARRRIVPMPPPGLRPKLSSAQVTDLSMCHWQDVEAISKGQGSREIAWSFIGGCLTWLNIAAALHARYQSEGSEYALTVMREQADAVLEMAHRYRKTRTLAFTGSGYQKAKEACDVMDALAEQVDRHTAIQCSEEAQRLVDAMVELEQ